MKLKDSEPFLLYSIIIILLLLISYLRIENQNNEKKLKIAFEKLKEEKWLQNNTLNKNIRSLDFLSLLDGKIYKPDLKNIALVFVNNISCDNCNNEYIKVYNHFKNNKRFLFVFNYEIITQFNDLREHILFNKNIFWDKNNNLLRSLDMEGIPVKPFCVLFRENHVILSCFLDDEKQISQIKQIVDINSTVM